MATSSGQSKYNGSKGELYKKQKNEMRSFDSPTDKGRMEWDLTDQ